MVTILTVHRDGQSLFLLRLHNNLLHVVDPRPDPVCLPELSRRVQQSVGREEYEDTLGDDLEDHDDDLTESCEILGVAPGVVGGVEDGPVWAGAHDPAPHLAGGHDVLVLESDRELQADLLGRGLQRRQRPAGEDDGPRPELGQPAHAEAWTEAPEVEEDVLTLTLEESFPTVRLLIFTDVNFVQVTEIFGLHLVVEDNSKELVEF